MQFYISVAHATNIQWTLSTRLNIHGLKQKRHNLCIFPAKFYLSATFFLPTVFSQDQRWAVCPRGEPCYESRPQPGKGGTLLNITAPPCLLLNNFCTTSTLFRISDIYIHLIVLKNPKYSMTMCLCTVACYYMVVCSCVSRWEPEAWGSVWTDSKPASRASHHPQPFSYQPRPDQYAAPTFLTNVTLMGAP